MSATVEWNATGAGTLTDEDHVWQSVGDILLTPVNTTSCAANYGWPHFIARI